MGRLVLQPTDDVIPVDPIYARPLHAVLLSAVECCEQPIELVDASGAPGPVIQATYPSPNVTVSQTTHADVADVILWAILKMSDVVIIRLLGNAL